MIEFLFIFAGVFIGFFGGLFLGAVLSTNKHADLIEEIEMMKRRESAR